MPWALYGHTGDVQRLLDPCYWLSGESSPEAASWVTGELFVAFFEGSNSLGTQGSHSGHCNVIVRCCANIRMKFFIMLLCRWNLNLLKNILILCNSQNLCKNCLISQSVTKASRGQWDCHKKCYVHSAWPLGFPHNFFERAEPTTWVRQGHLRNQFQFHFQALTQAQTHGIVCCIEQTDCII